MIPALIERLKRADERPVFSYQHYDDAHAPYDLAGKKATPFLSYLAEIAVVDTEIGKLLDFLESTGLAERTSIILSADHGEAFGEHGKQFHATTLYDELLRVPLYVRGPGIAPRRIDEPVTLMDIAPTILDGFGLPTPGAFMGQSLVPLLRGERVVFGRPVVAESDRGHRAMVFNDGIKLIADDKLHTLELFDLRRDPGEVENLADARHELANQRRALLDAFCDAHRLPR
jgi:arylsulfatase A-like enzyme